MYDRVHGSTNLKCWMVLETFGCYGYVRLLKMISPLLFGGCVVCSGWWRGSANVVNDNTEERKEEGRIEWFLCVLIYKEQIQHTLLSVVYCASQPSILQSRTTMDQRRIVLIEDNVMRLSRSRRGRSVGPEASQGWLVSVSRGCGAIEALHWSGDYER